MYNEIKIIATIKTIKNNIKGEKVLNKEGSEREDIMYKTSSILDIIICLVVFILAFYQGGFYKNDVVFTNLIICTIGLSSIMVKLIKNIKNNGVTKKVKWITILDVFVAFMPICYFLPILFKKHASLEGSLSEFITYFNFAIIYFIVRNTKNRVYYINTLILISLALAIIGIDEITFRSFSKFLGMFSISYLENSVGRISSTIQYANVTALVLLVGMQLLIYKILQIKPQEKPIKRFEPIILFLISFLNTAIILTESRMVNLMMLLSILSVIAYGVLTKNKNLVIKIVGSFLVTLITVKYIENAIAFLQYNNVVKAYLILVLITVIYMLLKTLVYNAPNLKKRFNIKRIQEAFIGKANKTKRNVVFLIFVAIIIFLLYISFSKGNNLHINTDKEGQRTAKSVKIKVEDKNQVQMDVVTLENSDYEIYVAEEHWKGKEKKLISTNEVDEKTRKKKEYVFQNHFNVSKDAKAVKIVLVVERGSVKVSNVKINNKKTIISWGLLPNKIMFRFADTFYNDNNTMLRKEYYKDAIKLSSKSTLIGIGGEGFLSRYQEVQNIPYISSEVHNAFLKILVEAGIIGVSIFSSIIVITYIIIKKTFWKNLQSIHEQNKKQTKNINNNNDSAFNFITLIMLTAFITVAAFDLMLSFQLMVIVLAIIIGMIVNQYKCVCTEEDKYIIDNKSFMGHVKIAIITTILICVMFVEYYSFKAYRASMIILKEPFLSEINNENAFENKELEYSYIKVAYLEKRTQDDNYNQKYLTSLNNEYINHIKILKNIYSKELDEKIKSSIEHDILEYIKKQKQNIDNMIEYEYYNKYVLEQAAKNYFNNFAAYSKIYNMQFQNEEVSYAFYLGYAMKLTERITEVGRVNVNANTMVKNIYREYRETLQNQNRYLKSETILSIVKDINEKLELLEVEK